MVGLHFVLPTIVYAHCRRECVGLVFLEAVGDGGFVYVHAGCLGSFLHVHVDCFLHVHVHVGYFLQVQIHVHVGCFLHVHGWCFECFGCFLQVQVHLHADCGLKVYYEHYDSDPPNFLTVAFDSVSYCPPLI